MDNAQPFFLLGSRELWCKLRTIRKALARWVEVPDSGPGIDIFPLLWEFHSTLEEQPLSKKKFIKYKINKNVTVLFVFIHV